MFIVVILISILFAIINCNSSLPSCAIGVNFWEAHLIDLNNASVTVLFAEPVLGVYPWLGQYSAYDQENSILYYGREPLIKYDMIKDTHTNLGHADVNGNWPFMAYFNCHDRLIYIMRDRYIYTIDPDIMKFNIIGMFNVNVFPWGILLSKDGQIVYISQLNIWQGMMPYPSINDTDILPITGLNGVFSMQAGGSSMSWYTSNPNDNLMIYIVSSTVYAESFLIDIDNDIITPLFNVTTGFRGFEVIYDVTCGDVINKEPYIESYSLCRNDIIPRIYIEWNFKDKIIYASNEALKDNINNYHSFSVDLNDNAMISSNGLECSHTGVAYTKAGINKAFMEKSIEVYIYRKDGNTDDVGLVSIDQIYDDNNNYAGFINNNYTNEPQYQYDSIEFGNQKYKIGSNFGERSNINDNGIPMINDNGVYEHLVITYSNDNSIKLYYNGVLYTNHTANNLATFNDSLYKILFCKSHGPLFSDIAKSFNGTIIKAAIYDYPISLNEITYLYQNRNASNNNVNLNEIPMFTSKVDELNICDNIDISFNIKINDVFPNAETDDLLIGSNPVISGTFCVYIYIRNTCVYSIYIRHRETITVDIFKEKWQYK